MALVLTLEKGDAVLIGDSVIRFEGGRGRNAIKIAIKAPKNVEIKLLGDVFDVNTFEAKPTGRKALNKGE